MKKTLVLILIYFPVIGFAQDGKSLALRIGPTSFHDGAYSAITIDNDEIGNLHRDFGLELELLFMRMHGDQNFFSRYRAGFTHSSFEAQLSSVGDYDGLTTGSSTKLRSAAGLGQRFQWGNIGLSFGLDMELAYMFPVVENSTGYYLVAQSDTMLEIVTTQDPGELTAGLNPFVNINYTFAKRFQIGVEFRHPFNVFFVRGHELYFHQRTETDGTVIEESSSVSRIKLTQFITPQIMLPPLISIGFQW